MPAAPSAAVSLTYIDRFPLPPEPEQPAVRLDKLKGLPEWRDPLGRSPADLPSTPPPPAASQGAAAGKPGEAAPGAAPAAEPKPEATVGVSVGDFIADIGSVVFPENPVRSDQRKLLRATFKTEIDENSSKLTVLTVIFGPKLYGSPFGIAARAWIWEHSLGALKRWFNWPWWGRSSTSSASQAQPAAEAKSAPAAKDAVIDVKAEPEDEPAPQPQPRPRPVGVPRAAPKPAEDEDARPTVTLTKEEIAAI